MNGLKPRYPWRITWPDPGDADSHKKDFMGWDGETPIGRIRLEEQGLKKNHWQWSGHGPLEGIRKRLLPQQGYCLLAREAAACVEDYYERLMAANGLKTSRPPSRGNESSS